MTRMIDSKKHRSSPASALLLSSGLIGLFVGLAAQAEPMRPRTAEPMRVEMRGAMATRSVSIARGRSAVIDLPTEASDVFVANPKIADAVLRTPKRIFILGVESGTTDAMFYDRMGRQILALSVHVLAPTDDISSLIHSHFPNSKIEVQAANDHLVLSGAVANVAEADQVQRLAAAYVDDPKKILNFLTVSGKDQVMLKVRVIEGAPPSIRGPAQARSAGKHSGLSGLVVKNDPQLRIVSIFVESTCKVARLHGMTARLT